MLLKIQWGLEYMDIFLIRHSEQLKLKGIKNVEESSQIENEKIILSIEGEKKAKEICKLKELNNIDTLWSSNYVRAIATSKYIAKINNIDIIITAISILSSNSLLDSTLSFLINTNLSNNTTP